MRAIGAVECPPHELRHRKTRTGGFVEETRTGARSTSHVYDGPWAMCTSAHRPELCRMCAGSRVHTADGSDRVLASVFFEAAGVACVRRCWAPALDVSHGLESRPVEFTTRPELRGSFGMVASTHWLASAAGMAV